MFRFLNKRYTDIFILISKDEMYLVFVFKKHRTKMLKGQRIFYAKVLTGELSIEEFFTQLRNWIETHSEDFILEILEDAPLHHRPVISIGPRIKLDFNVVEDSITSQLSSQYLS